MRVPRRQRPRSRKRKLVVVVADVILLGYGVDLLATGSTGAGLFLALLGGFLLVGEGALASQTRSPALERLGQVWAYVFLVGLPVWLAAIGAATLASGGSLAWGVVSFVLAGGLGVIVARGLLRRRRQYRS